MISLLIDESPRIILPSLACKIGLNEAIVLQQVHFLCSQPQSGIVDAAGNKWIWNTLDEWRDIYFPFWSKRTVQNILLSLEKQGFLVTTTRLRDKWDATKYYRVRRDLFFAETLVNTPLNETLSTTQDKTASITQSTTSSRLSSIEPSLYGTETSSETSSKNTHITHASERGDEVSEASGESDGEDDLQVGGNALNVEDESVLVLSPSSERSEGLEEESPGAGGDAAADRGEYAALFPYPFDQLYHAFEEYFDNQIGLCRITPAQIAFLEPETPLKDLEAWKETIDTYRGNFNAELGRYLPDKFATVIQVFKMHHSRLMRERRETGVTNGQKHILSITDREKEDAAYKAQNKLTAPPKSE